MAWCGLLGLVKCMPTFGSKPLVASKPQVIVTKSCVVLYETESEILVGFGQLSSLESKKCIPFTPFENAQRWMGKNTFPILLLNDDNMIGEH